MRRFSMGEVDYEDSGRRCGWEPQVKILATGQEMFREFASGPSLTAEEMVSGVLKAAEGWKYDLVSIGYPGPVLLGKPASEPHDLGPGWVGFDFEAAFGYSACGVGNLDEADGWVGFDFKAAFGCLVKLIKTTWKCKPWGATREERCSS